MQKTPLGIPGRKTGCKMTTENEDAVLRKEDVAELRLSARKEGRPEEDIFVDLCDSHEALRKRCERMESYAAEKMRMK